MNTQWLVPPNATRYQCPTTGRWFAPLSTRTTTVGGEWFVWAYCPLCDTHCHTREHPDYDPLAPQPHAYTIIGMEVAA